MALFDVHENNILKWLASSRFARLSSTGKRRFSGVASGQRGSELVGWLLNEAVRAFERWLAI